MATKSLSRRCLRAVRHGIAFLVGLCLVLGLASPSPAQAARELRWEDLLPPKAETVADPFAAMTPEQLADLARVEYMRWWLVHEGESADGGAIDPEFQRQQLARLEQKLAGQGFDVDRLLVQVEEERDRRRSQQGITHGELEGQLVRLPGYALPLDPNNPKELQAFLLVPYVGACIHVPTPPPNQIVFVEAQRAIKNPGTFSPVQITGELRQERRTYDLFLVDGSLPVEAGYSLRLEQMTPYRPEGESLLPRLSDLGLPEGHGDGLRGWTQGLQVWASAVLGRTMTHLQEQRSPAALALGGLLAFGYGVLHTLGPGHGKAVIISYFVGQGGSLGRGVTMGFRVAIFHVLSAVVVAVVTDVIVRQALGSAPGSYLVVRLVSYGAIAAIGFWMLRQAAEAQDQMAIASSGSAAFGGAHFAPGEHPAGPPTPGPINPLVNGSLALSPSLTGAVLAGDASLGFERQLAHRSRGICSCVGCGDGKGGWLSMAIGAVPCSGALLVLVYGLANDLLWASLVMVLAISLGMAVTLSAIGMGAIWGRDTASKRLGNPLQRQRRLQWVRLVAAGAVLMTGTFLFGITLVSALS